MPIYGAVIFGTIYMEFKYMWESIWNTYMYAMFLFLFINFFLMAMVIALLAVVQVYMQLTYQNYEWWWRTFFIGASGGIYVVLYTLSYLVAEMDYGLLWSDLVYLLYVYMFLCMYCCMCGTIACLAAHVFINLIYSHIKFD